MTETAAIQAERAELLLQRRREDHQQMIAKFRARLPVTVVFVLTGISVYAAVATFGIDWARAAGASGWEAAVWPIAVASTTVLALYCRVRVRRGLLRDWYLTSVRRLFDAVALAGFVLAAIGDGLHSGGHVHHLHPAVAVLVNAVPGFCLVLSGAMAALFFEAPRPPELAPMMPGVFTQPADASLTPLPVDTE